jgi:hypothetical protein
MSDPSRDHDMPWKFGLTKSMHQWQAFDAIMSRWRDDGRRVKGDAKDSLHPYSYVILTTTIIVTLSADDPIGLAGRIVFPKRNIKSLQKPKLLVQKLICYGKLVRMMFCEEQHYYTITALERVIFIIMTTKLF